MSIALCLAILAVAALLVVAATVGLAFVAPVSALVVLAICAIVFIAVFIVAEALIALVVLLVCHLRCVFWDFWCLVRRKRINAAPKRPCKEFKRWLKGVKHAKMKKACKCKPFKINGL